MNEERVIKFVRHPAFPAAQLVSRNPYLEIGEIVFELNGSNLAGKFKTGPGFWNDLLYFQDDVFSINGNVSTPINDAKGNLYGLSSRVILEKMLNPYVAPYLTSLVNNAGGNYGGANILEIGQTLSGDVSVKYGVSSPTNLLGNTPIIVSAGNIFTNEGPAAHSGTIALHLANPITPTSIITYNINLSLLHTQGTTSSVATSFSFFPKVIWGNTAIAAPVASDINNLAQKQLLITNSYKHDYLFKSTGYCVVALPAMLNPQNMTFTDVTDPNAPAGFGMTILGNISINNGVGTYQYTILRSTYFITTPNAVLRIS